MSENKLQQSEEKMEERDSSNAGYASVIGVCLMIVSFSFIISALIIKMLS